MDLIKIINRLENKGFNFSHEFVENNETILQVLIDETEKAITVTRCCTELPTKEEMNIDIEKGLMDWGYNELYSKKIFERGFKQCFYWMKIKMNM